MRLARILALLVGVSAAVQGARAAHLVEQSCVTACDDDDADGRCPPDCGDCTCCSHLAPTIVATNYVSLVMAPPQVHHFEGSDPIPSSADPHEVFHIPKSSRV